MNTGIENRNDERIITFLHSKGYNLFTIPKLTTNEINMLIEQENFEIREQERKGKLNNLKRRMKRG